VRRWARAVYRSPIAGPEPGASTSAQPHPNVASGANSGTSDRRPHPFVAPGARAAEAVARDAHVGMFRAPAVGLRAPDASPRADLRNRGSAFAHDATIRPIPAAFPGRMPRCVHRVQFGPESRNGRPPAVDARSADRAASTRFDRPEARLVDAQMMGQLVEDGGPDALRARRLVRMSLLVRSPEDRDAAGQRGTVGAPGGPRHALVAAEQPAARLLLAGQRLILDEDRDRCELFGERARNRRQRIGDEVLEGVAPAVLLVVRPSVDQDRSATGRRSRRPRYRRPGCAGR
jgi:hypothetical protein